MTHPLTKGLSVIITLSTSTLLRINSAKGLAVRFFAALRMTVV